MRLVVTGAGGFLGREVLRQLEALENVQVIVVTSKRELLCELSLPSNHYTIVTPDELLLKMHLLDGADVLLNCAFPRDADSTAMAEGLNFIKNLFRGASVRVPAVVNISSQSVYSQFRASSATEETPLSLESKYAVAKYSTELMLELSCPREAYANIRLASLIGPGFDQRVLNKLIVNALSGNQIRIQENKSRFGFLDVKDAAGALIQFVLSDWNAWEHVYNLGTMDGVTLTEMAGLAVAVAHEHGLEPPEPIIEISDRPAVNSTMISNRIESLLNWKPKVRMPESARIIGDNVVSRNDKGI